MVRGHVLDLLAAGETVLYGGSAVLSPMAVELARCADDTADEVVIADLDPAALDEARRRIPLAAEGISADEFKRCTARARRALVAARAARR